MAINEETLYMLGDIFSNTERPDKITVKVDRSSKKVTVVYDDLDEEWFKELVEAMASD